VTENYIQLKNNDQNKGETMYNDGTTKEVGKIVGFINNTQPITTNKQPNFISRGVKETMY